MAQVGQHRVGASHPLLEAEEDVGVVELQVVIADLGGLDRVGVYVVVEKEKQCARSPL